MTKGYASQGASILVKGFRSAVTQSQSCTCKHCGGKTTRKEGWPSGKGFICRPCKKDITKHYSY